MKKLLTAGVVLVAALAVTGCGQVAIGAPHRAVDVPLPDDRTVTCVTVYTGAVPVALSCDWDTAR